MFAASLLQGVSMRPFILKYGVISGVIVSVQMLIGIGLIGENGLDFDSGEILGYAGMLLALSMVFLGIKAFRDKELRGVIPFGKGFVVGSLIAVVASFFYVTTWEVYYQTNADVRENFMNRYIEHSLKKLTASGVSEEEVAQRRAEMEEMGKMYQNTAFRVGITFAEILPIGLLVALISAAILRKKGVIPLTS
jgi:hypothetical protein